MVWGSSLFHFFNFPLRILAVGLPNKRLEYPFDYCSKFTKIDATIELQIDNKEIMDPRIQITKHLIERYVAELEKNFRESEEDKDEGINPDSEQRQSEVIHGSMLNNALESANGVSKQDTTRPLFEMKQMTKENLEDQADTPMKTVKVHNHRGKISREVLFQHKVMYWSTYHGIKKFVRHFMKEKNINPWRICVDGENAVHCASRMHHYSLVSYFLSMNYVTLESTPISIKNVINISTTRNLETCLHLVCQNLPSEEDSDKTIEKAVKICDILIKKGKINKDAFNFRGWTAWNITEHPKIKAVEEAYDAQEKEEFEKSLEEQNLTIEEKYIKKYGKFESRHQFCLVVKGIETSERPGLVGKQLRNIKEDFDEKLHKLRLEKGKNHRKKSQNDKIVFFDYEAIPGFNDKNNYTFFVISLDSSLVNYFADKLGLLAYNFKLDIVTDFTRDNVHEFEDIRDAQVQRITLDILKEEFDLNAFVKSGILIDYFPLHEFQEREEIKKYWRKERFNSSWDMLTPETNMKALLPLCSIASYYGPYVLPVSLMFIF